MHLKPKLLYQVEDDLGCVRVRACSPVAHSTNEAETWVREEAVLATRLQLLRCPGGAVGHELPCSPDEDLLLELLELFQAPPVPVLSFRVLDTLPLISLLPADSCLQPFHLRCSLVHSSLRSA